MTPSRHSPTRAVAVGLGLGTGVLVALLGVVIPRLLPLDPVFAALELPLITGGAGIGLMAVALGWALAPRSLFKGSALLLATLGTLGLAETVSRWIAHDFRGQEAAWRRLPPYYRQPRTPSGSVYFRRDGPETWVGQPIRAWLQQSGSAAYEAYREEPRFAVHYDALGFRNEDPRQDPQVDTHLNAAGSRRVAQELARHFNP